MFLANVLVISFNYQIWKQLDSENKHIHLRPIPHALRNWQVLYYVRKLITTNELKYYMNLRVNFNLNKFENLNQRWDVFQFDGMKSTKQWFSKLWMFYLCKNLIFFDFWLTFASQMLIYEYQRGSQRILCIYIL